MDEVKFCPHCGAQVKSDFHFCPQCAAELDQQPSYKDIFDEPFRRAEAHLVIQKLDRLLVKLDQIDEDLLALLS